MSMSGGADILFGLAEVHSGASTSNTSPPSTLRAAYNARREAKRNTLSFTRTFARLRASLDLGCAPVRGGRAASIETHSEANGLDRLGDSLLSVIGSPGQFAE
jgi:hypothetical protein